ncbi:MAG: NAD(P)-binding domain-containing protein [Gammaproteobacteria bacterium]|nr:NAD(P)-binding domain-containing protein [Gammaproteobacteria bacterium]MDH3466283.1 NAD(P)-binding domain-containing protein [Gammaproteobacteria bacterium]
MKILIADKFPAAYLAQLETRGHTCDTQPELGADDLPDVIGDFDAIIVRSTRVTAATITAASSLKLIIRAGAGTNTIDKATAADHGVRVCNVPGKNAIAVAELTMALLLAIDRNVADNVQALREGRWDKKRFSQAKGLFGRKMGIIGLGAIGLAVAERARAFGIHLYVVAKPDRSAVLNAQLAALGVHSVDSIDELATSCDILTFHVPAAAETKGLIGPALLARMPDGGIILNTSRGDIVDEAALLAAMDKKGLRAGLDVYADEPSAGQAEFCSALAQHPNVYGTHHIGASTAQAQNAVAEGVIEIIDAYVDGDVLHCVNM